MKKSEILQNLLLILMTTLLITNQYFYKMFEPTSLFYIIFFGVFLFLSILISGIDKDKYMYKVEINQVVFIYVLCYLIFTFILGVFTGFIQSPFGLAPLRVIKNITPTLVIIIISELFRFTIVNKSQKRITDIMVSGVFVLCFLVLNIDNYPVTCGMDVFELVGVLILPTICNSLLLTYMVKHFGFQPAMLYRIIQELYIYLVPVIPDIGIYLESVFGILIPVIVYLKLSKMTNKNNIWGIKKESLAKKIYFVPLTMFLIALAMLISGLFKHKIMSVGSNSMYDKIKYGDAVVIESLKQDELDTLKVGDILAHIHDGKIIIHRIISIREKNEKYIFNTKGDNNDTKDDYDISESAVVGKVVAKIPYIGYPSVWISEQVK